ncbi:hypothetical protein Trisim1_011647 [Trichoderma cf. simile WF8]
MKRTGSMGQSPRLWELPNWRAAGPPLRLGLPERSPASALSGNVSLTAGKQLPRTVIQQARSNRHARVKLLLRAHRSIKPLPSEFRADMCTPFDTKPTWPWEWPLHVSMRLTFASVEPRLLSDPGNRAPLRTSQDDHPLQSKLSPTFSDLAPIICGQVAKSIDGGNNAANLPMTLTGVQRLAS